jgi:GxxExxY protein
VEAGAKRIAWYLTQRRRNAEKSLSKEVNSILEVTKGAESQASRLPNELTEIIIGAAIEVHRHLGPGLLESAYEECLCYELNQMGLRFERQVHMPILYKGIKLQCAHKMDLVVEDSIVVELKATEGTSPLHSAQLLTYLKSSGKSVGLLINFNVPVLKNGLKRVVNRYAPPMLPTSASSVLSIPDAEAQRHGENLKESSRRVSQRLSDSASNPKPSAPKERT